MIVCNHPRLMGDRVEKPSGGYQIAVGIQVEEE
jgi:hypothetical protein